MAGYPCDSSVMGIGILRILSPGPGEPYRLFRQRRSVQYHAAESHSGGRFIDGFHCNRHLPVQRAADPVESSRSLFLSDYGGIFRFPKINFAKKLEKIWIVRKNAYLCNPKRENNVRET